MISFNSVKLACLNKFKKQLGVVEHNRVCHNSNALCGMDKVKHKVYVRIFTGNKTFTVWICKKLVVHRAVKLCCIAVIYQCSHDMLFKNAL